MATLFMLLLVVVGVFLAYLLVLGFFGIRIQGKDTPWREDISFVVLIPAHNEEKVLPGLFACLRNLNYPQDKLQVMFVADHCTDATVSLISEAGFEVLDRQTGTPGKAAALNDAIAKLKDRLHGDKSALAIFDADNIIHPDFFRWAAAALDNGALLVQGNTGIANKTETVFTKLNYINFAVTNRLKELARSQAGLSCRLRGHGMAFAAKIVQELEWGTSSLVEDQELLIRVVMNGHRVVWEHKARVDSIIPASTETAAMQRRRWAGGKSVMTGPVVGRLLRKAVVDRDMVAFDLAVDYLMPSYAILLGLSLMGLIGALVTLGAAPVTDGFATVIALFLGYFLLGSLLEGVPVRLFGWFVVSPVFIFWRVWIFISSLRGASRWH